MQNLIYLAWTIQMLMMAIEWRSIVREVKVVIPQFYRFILEFQI